MFHLCYLSHSCCCLDINPNKRLADNKECSSPIVWPSPFAGIHGRLDLLSFGMNEKDGRNGTLARLAVIYLTRPSCLYKVHEPQLVENMTGEVTLLFRCERKTSRKDPSDPVPSNMCLFFCHILNVIYTQWGDCLIIMIVDPNFKLHISSRSYIPNHHNSLLPIMMLLTIPPRGKIPWEWSVLSCPRSEHETRYQPLWSLPKEYELRSKKRFVFLIKSPHLMTIEVSSCYISTWWYHQGNLDQSQNMT